ncbi:MAG: YggS family pyridoxal phosphate-dependent enzyme [Alphaproteobacteria bacterium]|nr:YggS family pyridoxal phosphate-dependent enzyme [Alphaproteobacteria bacterium]
MPAASITANLAAVKDKIAVAARAAARDPASVRLVAVSKTRPAEAVREALAAGQRHFGENRVQEALRKFPALREDYPDISLHLIGPLQTNKAEEAVRLFDVIEVLDRPKLAIALAKAMEKTGRRPALYIEVNSGDEPQKSGVPRAGAGEFICHCRDEMKLPVTGLMCIPPAGEDPARHFSALAALARAHGLPHVSMGMSGDYEAAIAGGATSVRVGSAIFGQRG